VGFSLRPYYTQGAPTAAPAGPRPHALCKPQRHGAWAPWLHVTPRPEHRDSNPRLRGQAARRKPQKGEGARARLAVQPPGLSFPTCSVGRGCSGVLGSSPHHRGCPLPPNPRRATCLESHRHVHPPLRSGAYPRGAWKPSIRPHPGPGDAAGEGRGGAGVPLSPSSGPLRCSRRHLSLFLLQVGGRPAPARPDTPPGSGGGGPRPVSSILGSRPPDTEIRTGFSEEPSLIPWPELECSPNEAAKKTRLGEQPAGGREPGKWEVCPSVNRAHFEVHLRGQQPRALIGTPTLQEDGPYPGSQQFTGETEPQEARDMGFMKRPSCGLSAQTSHPALG
jgi:hypothetical protein